MSRQFDCQVDSLRWRQSRPGDAGAVDRFARMANDEEDPKKGGVTRRGFLLGTGVTAASTVALEACRPADGPNGDGASNGVFGPGRVAVTLRLNGVERRLEVEAQATLADALRDELGLTGTKVVCDRGS